MDHDQLQVESTDQIVWGFLDRFRKLVGEALRFVWFTLEKSHVKDDYKKLLELVLIFLSGESSNGMHFKTPGAIRMYQWMAKPLYPRKISLLTSNEELAIWLHDLACLDGTREMLVHISWGDEQQGEWIPTSEIQCQVPCHQRSRDRDSVECHNVPLMAGGQTHPRLSYLLGKQEKRQFFFQVGFRIQENSKVTEIVLGKVE